MNNNNIHQQERVSCEQAWRTYVVRCCSLHDKRLELILFVICCYYIYARTDTKVDGFYTHIHSEYCCWCEFVDTTNWMSVRYCFINATEFHLVAVVCIEIAHSIVFEWCEVIFISIWAADNTMKACTLYSFPSRFEVTGLLYLSNYNRIVFFEETMIISKSHFYLKARCVWSTVNSVERRQYAVNIFGVTWCAHIRKKPWIYLRWIDDQKENNKFLTKSSDNSRQTHSDQKWFLALQFDCLCVCVFFSFLDDERSWHFAAWTEKKLCTIFFLPSWLHEPRIFTYRWRTKN